MSPEEAEPARKRYLLERFWISGRGFWGKRGDRIAWIASVGLLLLIIFNVAVQYGINIWNREIFDAIEKRRFCDRALALRGVLSAGIHERRPRRRGGFRANGYPAALARLAD